MHTIGIGNRPRRLVTPVVSDVPLQFTANRPATMRFAPKWGSHNAIRPEWGSHNVAQGKAKRSPGYIEHAHAVALKGQNHDAAILLGNYTIDLGNYAIDHLLFNS